MFTQARMMKNLQRGLLLAIELAEAGLPFVLNLNMADEAQSRGISVDGDKLSDLLGVPVIATVATEARGLEALTRSLSSAVAVKTTVVYPEPIERAIREIETHLPQTQLSGRTLSLILLAGDSQLCQQLGLSESVQSAIQLARQGAEKDIDQPIHYEINRRRSQYIDNLLGQVVRRESKGKSASQIGGGRDSTG